MKAKVNVNKRGKFSGWMANRVVNAPAASEGYYKLCRFNPDRSLIMSCNDIGLNDWLVPCSRLNSTKSGVKYINVPPVCSMVIFIHQSTSAHLSLWLSVWLSLYNSISTCCWCSCRWGFLSQPPQADKYNMTLCVTEEHWSGVTFKWEPTRIYS